MVCRRRRDDAVLCRAGRSLDGVWYLGRGVGRGVWWCSDAECESGLNLARVSRALRRPMGEADLAGLLEVAQRSKTAVVVEE